MTTDTSKGEKYATFPFVMGLTETQGMFCFDQAKANMLYLVEPRVDTEGIDAARHNPIADSIHQHMSKDIRGWLQKLPLQFLDWWLDIDKGFGTIQGTVMSADWPANYQTVMAERAHIAQKRILGVVEEGNVKRVNFRRAG